MDPISSAAIKHIRKLEERCKQQTALIERLKRSGQNAAEAERTLLILQRALAEMRIQLDQLLPTETKEGKKPTRR